MLSDDLGPAGNGDSRRRGRYRVTGGFVFVGCGAMNGVEMEPLTSPSLDPSDLVCRECGLVKAGVDSRVFEAEQRFHERHVHPEVFAEHLRLMDELLRLQLELWE